MKRRKMLQLLGLAPPAWLLSSCHEKLPKSATVVTGKIIDDNGAPLENVGVKLLGLANKFPSVTVTFENEVLTNKDGAFSISIVVPRKTDFVQIIFYETLWINLDRIIDNTPTYKPFYLIEGKPVEILSGIRIPKDSWGKTYNINFLFKKI